MHDDVVDAHRHQILADAVEQSGLDGDLELGADAVGGRHQHRILEARRLEIEQAAEAAQIGVGAGPPRGAGGGRDARDQCLARVDIHAGVFISEAVFAGHGPKGPRRKLRLRPV